MNHPKMCNRMHLASAATVTVWQAIAPAITDLHGPTDCGGVPSCKSSISNTVHRSSRRLLRRVGSVPAKWEQCCAWQLHCMMQHVCRCPSHDVPCLQSLPYCGMLAASTRIQTWAMHAQYINCSSPNDRQVSYATSYLHHLKRA